MPFPKTKTYFNYNYGTCPKETSHEDPETGIIITENEAPNKKLPDAEFFEIHNQIKAGVTLNEVNTNIINNNNGINIPDLEKTIETTIKSTKTKKSTNNEVTNEDK